MTLTPSRITPPLAVDADIAEAAARFLTPVVIDLTALATDGKQAHWHVRGPAFQEVHELLDAVVVNVRGWADLAAERVVALGMPIDVRSRTVGRNATTPELRAGFLSSEEAISEIVAGIDATLKTVRNAVTGLAEIDPVSQDVAIEIARGLDKDRWFLSAHLPPRE